MKILVCISKVPDTTSKINFVDNNTKFDENGVQYIVNPYDEWYALVRALELVEASGGTVTTISGEIAYHLQRHAFDYLDAPVLRVMQADTPFAFSKVLIDEALPSVKRIVDAVKSSLYVS